MTEIIDDFGDISRAMGTEFLCRFAEVVDVLRRANGSLTSLTIDIGGKDIPLQEHLVTSLILNYPGTNIIEDGPHILRGGHDTNPRLTHPNESIELVNRFRDYVFSHNPELQRTFFDALKCFIRIRSTDYSSWRVGPAKKSAFALTTYIAEVAHNPDLITNISGKPVAGELERAVSEAMKIAVDYELFGQHGESLSDVGVLDRIGRRRQNVKDMKCRLVAHAGSCAGLMNKLGDAYRENRATESTLLSGAVDATYR